MILTLTADDQSLLQDALRVLLSPLAYADVASWQRAVNDRARALLNADTASFVMPVNGMPQIHSGLAGDVARMYADLVEPLHSQLKTCERHVELKICDRRTLWAPHLDEYYKSDYYNEYIRPNRLFDYIGMAAPLGRPFSNATVANLLLHHTSRTTRPFGDRGLALLGLVFPAFEAGVRVLTDFHGRQSKLMRSLDAVNEKLLVCDATGQILHCNRALTDMMSREPQHETLLAAMLDVGRLLGELARGRRRILSDGDGMNRSVQTERSTYQIRGTYINESGAAEAEDYILVALKSASHHFPAPQQLRERFDLTRREADVALLLAKRRRNDEIADELCVSTHTARRHTENVLSKLGIHSRDDVAKTISKSVRSH